MHTGKMGWGDIGVDTIASHNRVTNEKNVSTAHANEQQGSADLPKEMPKPDESQ